MELTEAPPFCQNPPEQGCCLDAGHEGEHCNCCTCPDDPDACWHHYDIKPQ